MNIKLKGTKIKKKNRTKKKQINKSIKNQLTLFVIPLFSLITILKATNQKNKQKVSTAANGN